MTSLPIPKAGDAVTASLWNQYAEAINRTWAMETDGNFRLTKSEPWRLEYLGSSFFTTGGPFNAPIYRVFVDRGDGWDSGSTDDPRAFYLAGTFTSFGGHIAMRAAKFYKDQATGRTVFSKVFASQNQFSGVTNNIITTRDGSAIIYYSTTPKSRNGGDMGYAWLIDPTTDDLTTGFNLVPSADFGGSAIAYMGCTLGRLAVHNFTDLIVYELPGGTETSRASNINVHNVVADDVFFYFSSQIAAFPGQNVYGYVEPQGIKKLNSMSLTQDATWEATGGGGTSVPCFNMVITQKQIWNGTYDPITGGPKIISIVATREYGGSGGYHWNGDTFATPGAGEGAVFRLTSDAILYHPGPPGPYEEDFTFTLNGSVAGCSPRLELFFNDPDDELWFGGGVSQLNPQRDAPQSVTPQRLYRFNRLTQDFTEFSGFNGPVRHAAYFCDGPTQGRQFIVVGDFTEYNGEPAEYIMFMDGAGNRLEDLEWP